MRFFTTATVALTAFASTVYGLAAPAPATVTAPAAVPTVSGVSVSGGSNPIRQPLGDVALEAGQPFTIKWDANYGDKVTLILRKGDTDNLDIVVEIVETENTGSYTWTPPKELEGDDDYSIQIVAGSATNYSPRFTIKSEGAGIKSSSTTSATSSSETTSTATKKSSSATASESAEASGSASPSSTTTRRASASSTEEPITAASDPADNAAGQLSSPLALVLCIAASLVYFY
ncbi:Ser-Thr-rich glycosyl-phosphatidyl-inositol-anchored membrane family-domain-containing protein [Tricharina praecox]|uniref:Ser-Thr-rich glycosyl-phosphatidyl-inositol-anchored membrane family-domain-containing protein n=1 Tax=Tricharina praecox TaxID=43433 RepID=UPI002220838D|nr:Ser-Thr-rich glycosyl-phosphatidyl-inositol-anchored membrane family-domain-containing protein [Tricharina praecox]KAI5857718.1 Ser-Thr-rich glycosyl-phosphatidyl-inositol-anchored membrane family-domain-containing protein [Tricharina praecox]